MTAILHWAEAPHFLRPVFAGIVFFGSVLAASAVLVDNTTTLNETAPANGAPWGTVGYINGASGVYLQNGWVITAQHVVGSSTSVSINFNGNSFSSIGAITTLTNPDSSASDVVLFNIGTTPAGASNLGVTSTRPRTNAQLTMIGEGSHRSGSLTTINYTGGTANGYLWDEVTGTKAWGTNYSQLSNLSSDVTAQAPGHNAFQAFYTGFTADGFSNTAQATLGDSGGGVFVKNGSTWQLAGTMNAIAGYSGQTGSTSANGDATYIADMAAYSSQIDPIIAGAVPEPSSIALLLLTFAFLAPVARKKIRPS